MECVKALYVSILLCRKCNSLSVQICPISVLPKRCSYRTWQQNLVLKNTRININSYKISDSHHIYLLNNHDSWRRLLNRPSFLKESVPCFSFFKCQFSGRNNTRVLSMCEVLSPGLFTSYILCNYYTHSDSTVKKLLITNSSLVQKKTRLF
jgi:hypothetical protein